LRFVFQPTSGEVNWAETGELQTPTKITIDKNTQNKRIASLLQKVKPDKPLSHCSKVTPTAYTLLPYSAKIVPQLRGLAPYDFPGGFSSLICLTD
jgi:hypothetical protein